jgi:hypothetical protein
MNKFMKVGIVGVLSLGILAGCGEVEKVETTSGSSGETKTEAPTEQKAKPTDNLKVGETVKIDDFEITLNSAEKFEPTEFDYVEKEGYQFIVVDVNVKNVSKEQADPSSLMLSLKTEDGSTTMNAYSSKEESQWADNIVNKLPAGSGFKAQTSFEVKPEMISKPFEVIIQNAITGGQAIYKHDGIK